jgi:alpha-beta hydrolase superfamily lysophospholipase
MVAWPGAADACISGGTATGLANLWALTDADGVALPAAIPAGASLTVTGHSLGGTLAPVVALKLAEAAPGRAITAVSFAGMTPGDAGFAALFEPGTALDGKVRRVFRWGRPSPWRAR